MVSRAHRQAECLKILVAFLCVLSKQKLKAKKTGLHAYQILTYDWKFC